MVSRSEVLAEARTWIGTRFQHQGRVKGAGVDCAGLVIGVARDLGLADAKVEGYSRHPDGVSLLAFCRQYMLSVAVGEAVPADVLIFSFASHPQHLAFRSELDGRPALIHAFADARCVVEHDFDEVWQSRLRAAFRIPGVE